jgi:hypothetical protein
VKRALVHCLVLSALSTVRLDAQLPWRAGAAVSLADHRVTAGAGLERSSGTLFGLSIATVVPWHALETRVTLSAGSLGATDDAAVDRDVGEVTVEGSLPLNTWIAADAGLVIRRYESSVAAQRWVWGHVGAEAHAVVIDDALRISGGLALAPWVSVSGISRPDLAVIASTELAYTNGRLVSTMRYRLERFDFPARHGVRRLEQMSSLQIGVAWRMR